jgi:hypothetical protein
MHMKQPKLVDAHRGSAKERGISAVNEKRKTAREKRAYRSSCNRHTAEAKGGQGGPTSQRASWRGRVQRMELTLFSGFLSIALRISVCFAASDLD